MQRYHSVFFQYMRKMSLVNETLRPETETRPRRLTFSPRRDRDRDVSTFLRDRGETETLGKCVSRLSRDRDVETETTSLSFLSHNMSQCMETPLTERMYMALAVKRLSCPSIVCSQGEL